MDKKLIVIEGLDGSGKNTQTQLLHNAIKDSVIIDYPNYNNRSCELVKMYLNGEIDEDPFNVNPYLASTFYACDRAITLNDWIDKYNNGNTIIANRYIGSNIIHQMVKLPKNEWNDFIDWCIDLECNKFKLPYPTKVFFLKVSPKISEILLRKRYTVNGVYDESKKDIHEKNIQYLEKCTESAMYAAYKMHWEVIECSNGLFTIYTPEEIHNMIMRLL